MRIVAKDRLKAGHQRPEQGHIRVGVPASAGLRCPVAGKSMRIAGAHAAGAECHDRGRIAFQDLQHEAQPFAHRSEGFRAANGTVMFVPR